MIELMIVATNNENTEIVALGCNQMITETFVILKVIVLTNKGYLTNSELIDSCFDTLAINTIYMKIYCR